MKIEKKSYYQKVVDGEIPVSVFNRNSFRRYLRQHGWKYVMNGKDCVQHRGLFYTFLDDGYVQISCPQFSGIAKPQFPYETAPKSIMKATKYQQQLLNIKFRGESVLTKVENEVLRETVLRGAQRVKDEQAARTGILFGRVVRGQAHDQSSEDWA